MFIFSANNLNFAKVTVDVDGRKDGARILTVNNLHESSTLLTNPNEFQN